MLGNYNYSFIHNLQSQVNNKIALLGDKDIKNRKYALGLKEVSGYEDLLELSRILENILACSSCYKDINIEDVVTFTKEKLNLC